MLQTITLGSCVSVQGLFVAKLADGNVVVRVDGKEFTGLPVQSQKLTPRATA